MAAVESTAATEWKNGVFASILTAKQFHWQTTISGHVINAEATRARTEDHTDVTKNRYCPRNRDVHFGHVFANLVVLVVTGSLLLGLAAFSSSSHVGSPSGSSFAARPRDSPPVDCDYVPVLGHDINDDDINKTAAVDMVVVE